jgi:hypothetical protein
VKGAGAHRERRWPSDGDRRRGLNQRQLILHDQGRVRGARRQKKGNGEHLGASLTMRGEIRSGATRRTA